MYQEVINFKRRELFQKFINFPDFYLAGGTSLALQIGHRNSVDFDFFTPTVFKKNFNQKIKEIFHSFSIKISLNRKDQKSFFINNIKIDFVYYPFPLILKPLKYKDVFLAKIPEIGAMKAHILGRRIEFKDYIDLYFIMKKKFSSLKEIISLAERKYKNEFNKRLFLEQLVYLDDVAETKIDFLKEKVKKREIEKFFQNQVKKLALF